MTNVSCVCVRGAPRRWYDVFMSNPSNTIIGSFLARSNKTTATKINKLLTDRKRSAACVATTLTNDFSCKVAERTVREYRQFFCA